MRPDFRAKCVRAGFIYFIIPALGRDVIFVSRLCFHVWYKPLPDSDRSARSEGIRLRVPSVTVPDHAGLSGVGGPHGEIDPTPPGRLAEVRPHLLAGAVVCAFRQQIQIKVA